MGGIVTKGLHAYFHGAVTRFPLLLTYALGLVVLYSPERVHYVEIRTTDVTVLRSRSTCYGVEEAHPE